MNRLHTFLAGAVGGFTLLMILLLYPQNARELVPEKNMDKARKLYEAVLKVDASSTSKDAFEKIIQERLQCYEENWFYADRVEMCRSTYMTDLVQEARKTIKSMPDMGNFLVKVRNCPIVYSICKGEREGDSKGCVQVERQCIDYVLDRYWRGTLPDSRNGF